LRLSQERYNSLVVKIPKVPENEFKAAIRALLNEPPMSATAIQDKRPRKADAQKPGPRPKAR
jgi:hypothetical protein